MQQHQPQKPTMFNRWPGYPRTEMDMIIDVNMALCIILGIIFVFLTFANAFGSTPFKIFTGLTAGAITIASILYAVRTFRRMLWQEREDRKGKVDTAASRKKRVIIGVVLIGVTIPLAFGLHSLYLQWSWIGFFMPACGYMAMYDLVLIVQALTSKKRDQG
jgi:hypothetical protein